ncbi:MAG: hypothetical protein HY554_14265 [Elusimicrobia bacterium]|nr:hypothetical protein [Elusimicrobiota bacterium]
MNQRGVALVAVLLIVALLALLADGVARVGFQRALVFGQTRDGHYSRLATASAASELRACLHGSAFPSPAACPGWSGWVCGAGCVATRTFSFGGGASGSRRVDVLVEATWSSDRLDFRATPAAP